MKTSTAHPTVGNHAAISGAISMEGKKSMRYCCGVDLCATVAFVVLCSNLISFNLCFLL